MPDNCQSRTRVIVTSPATGEMLNSFAVANKAEVDTAITSARSAAQRWAELPVKQRASHLARVRKSLVRSAEDLAETVNGETGKPVPDALFEIFGACGFIRWIEKVAAKSLGPTRVGTGPLILKKAWVEYSPLGVVGVITPWNYPIGIPFQSLPYLLIAGNTAVLKPSEYAPTTGDRIAEIVNGAGEELIQVVQGDGSTGKALVEGDIDALVFTGSAETGTQIRRSISDRGIPTVLELGGKDPMIVCDDADVSLAARSAATAAFANGGQTCVAAERILVHEAVYQQFLAEVTEAAHAMQVGSSIEDHVGPLVIPGQGARLLERVAAAEAAGAQIITGGAMRGESNYMEPTVLTDVEPNSDIYTEESFGPIMTVVRVVSDDEAIRLANDSAFGLRSSVFSKDSERARRIASRLETGGSDINDVMIGTGVAALPFGGWKGSGMNTLQGEAALHFFSRTQSMTQERVGAGAGITAKMFGNRRPKPEQIRRIMKTMYG